MRLFEGTPFDIPPRCERCEELEADCTCEPLPPPRLDPQKQTANVKLEKRKRGKIVTVVSGLPEGGNDLPDLLSQLKTHCGAGGALKNATLEIQGDQLSRVQQKLEQIGFKVKVK